MKIINLEVAVPSVFALASASKRADNKALPSGLPDLEVKPEAVIADVDAGRAGR